LVFALGQIIALTLSGVLGAFAPTQGEKVPRAAFEQQIKLWILTQSQEEPLDENVPSKLFNLTPKKVGL
jgi:hypothetical protein